jgi:hypothetical protein
MTLSKDQILKELGSFKGMSKQQLEPHLEALFGDSSDYFHFEGQRWFTVKTEVFGRHGELTVRLNSDDMVFSATFYVEGNLPEVKNWMESLKLQFDVVQGRDIVTYHSRVDKNCLEVAFDRKYRSELLNIVTLHYEGCDKHS